MVLSVYIKPLLVLLVTLAIIGIAAVVFWNAPHGAAPEKNVTPQLPHNIDVALKKAHFSEIQDGVVAWELIAERVNYDKTGDRAYLSDVKMLFQRNKSHGAVTVTADNGEYSSKTKKILLNGHVHLVTEDGATFETNSIIYTGATEQFSTSDTVTFKQERLQLKAVGMDLGVKNQQAHFRSAVVATIIMN
jgi:LPS export ABC transporter protein LptC